MIETIALIMTSLFITMVFIIIFRAFIKKQSIFGKPAIPVYFFIPGKILPFINLIFLFLRGLNIEMNVLFSPVLITDIISLSLLIIGCVIVLISSSALKDDLIFGLSSSKNHTLQTEGIYSISRHPFYLGFLLILLSSVLFYPHIINILSFTGAWCIHHFIMNKEEEHLISEYGDEYRQYAVKTNRYLTLKKRQP